MPVFISSLTYTRARGGRRRALADGRTMVAGADDERGHRQPIAKFRALTLTRFYFFSHLYARARRAPPRSG